MTILNIMKSTLTPITYQKHMTVILSVDIFTFFMPLGYEIKTFLLSGVFTKRFYKKSLVN